MSYSLNKLYTKNYFIRQPKKYTKTWLLYQKAVWTQLSFKASRKFLVRQPKAFLKILFNVNLNKIPKRLKMSYFSDVSILSDPNFSKLISIEVSIPEIIEVSIPEIIEVSIPEIIEELRLSFKRRLNYSSLLAAEVEVTSLGELTSIIKEELAENITLATSFCHDDYRENQGGLQLCVAREQQSLIADGITSLVIAPVKSFGSLAKGENDDPYVKIILNKKEIGKCRESQLALLHTNLAGQVDKIIFIIHSFMGHSLEQLGKVIDSVDSVNYFWIHDYFTLCENHNLKRNGINVCHAPDSSSNSCNICFYGEQRRENIRLFTSFFEGRNFKGISPSEFAKNLWFSRSSYSSIKEVKVVEHVVLEKEEKRATRLKNNKIKIAYIGTIGAHKGWNEFEMLTARLDPDVFDFYYFGIGSHSNHRVKNIAMSIVDEDSNSGDVIRKESIDIAFIWSDWPETFCFTAHEALFAGAYIVTNQYSGNVAVAVEEKNQGAVFSSLEGVIKFLESDDLVEIIANENIYTGYNLSKMTTEIL